MRHRTSVVRGSKGVLAQFVRGFLSLPAAPTATLPICLTAGRRGRNWTSITACLYIHSKRLDGVTAEQSNGLRLPSELVTSGVSL